MDSIRAFVNNLQDAYKDNRVYVITWISISSRSTDEVEKTRARIFGTGPAAQDQTDRNTAGRLHGHATAANLKSKCSPTMEARSSTRQQCDGRY